jgi:hypothetical protein
MSIAEETLQLKQDFDEVYAAGYKSFWDIFTKNATTNDCRYMFYGENWTDEVFTPPYAIVPNPSASRYMFQESGITKVTSKQLDLSKAKTIRQTFALSNIEEVEIVVGYATLNATFENVETLTTLTLTVGADTTYTNAFIGCSGLTNLTIDGTIGKAGFDLSDCTNLTLESIKSVLEACNKEQANIVVTLPEYCEGGNIYTIDACMADGNYGIEGLTTAYSNAMNKLHNYSISFN